MTKKTRTTATLRETLFNEMDDLISGAAPDSRANAVARLSNSIIATSRLELECASAGSGRPEAVGL